MTMTDEELKAIEERTAKADSGPWELHMTHPWVITAYDDQTDILQVIRNVESEYRANADFVVHARTDVPALCALVRKLHWELSEARNWLARFQNDHDAYALGMEVGQRQEHRSNRALLVQCRDALSACCSLIFAHTDEFQKATPLIRRIEGILGDGQATSSPDAPTEAG